MTAQWKIPKLDRTKRLNDLERLQQRVAELEAKLVQVTDACKFFRERNEAVTAELRQANKIKSLFNSLLQEEVMVPTKDGFKLLTGGELREYCERLSVKARQNKSLDDLMEAFTIKISQQITNRYVNPRSQSQESDQENA